MDEISNKTLATLLVVAIVISLAGTFFAMRGVTQVTNYVTGAQTQDQGEAKLNITSKTSFTLNYATVSFGGGYRNESCIVATYNGGIDTEINMSSNESDESTQLDACWIVDPAGTYYPGDLQLENDGNVYLNVTINSTNQANDGDEDPTNGGFFDSCDFKVVSGGNGDISWAAKNVEADSCNSNLDTTDGTFTGSHELLCSNFSYVDTSDLMNITISLDIPSGPTGECETTIDFVGVRST